jgi:hypothetical protein
MYFEKIASARDIKETVNVSSVEASCSDYCPYPIYGPVGGCCKHHGEVYFFVIVS